jgi:hypothetical protein
MCEAVRLKGSLVLSKEVILYETSIKLWEGIFKLLWIPGIDSGNLRSLAGLYNNPIPTRFLAPIDCSKIPALDVLYV